MPALRQSSGTGRAIQGFADAPVLGWLTASLIHTHPPIPTVSQPSTNPYNPYREQQVMNYNPDDCIRAPSLWLYFSALCREMLGWS